MKEDLKESHYESYYVEKFENMSYKKSYQWQIKAIFLKYSWNIFFINSINLKEKNAYKLYYYLIII